MIGPIQQEDSGGANPRARGAHVYHVYKDVNFSPTSVQFKRVIARPFRL